MYHSIDPCHESDAQLHLIKDLESNQPAGKILTTMYYKSGKNKKSSQKHNVHQRRIVQPENSCLSANIETAIGNRN
jgi:hypothetical protein